MIHGLAKLYEYFGVIGILSTVLWISTLTLLARHARSRLRTGRYWTALAMAAVGLFLAKVNSVRVSAVRVDETQTIKENIERQGRLNRTLEEAKAEEKREREQAGAARKAKRAGAPGPAVGKTADEGEDTTDKAGDETDGKADRAEGEAKEKGQAAEKGDVKTPDKDVSGDSEEGPAFAYKAQGKVERTKGKKNQDEVLAQASDIKVSQDSGSARKMAQADVHRANHLDRLNLFFARVVLWLSLVLVGADYMSRFNETFRAYFPLPLSCGAVDGFWCKRFTVCVHTAHEGAVRDFLERSVRKGETFIYFCRRDPWPDPPGLPAEATPVVPAKRARAMLPRVRVFGVEWLPVKKLSCREGDPGFGSTFVLESAWFSRYCFVVVGEALGQAWARDLREFLLTRKKVLAAARRTVNVVWEHAGLPDRETMADLLTLCPLANYRLVVVAPASIVGAWGAQFGETVEELSAPSRTPIEGLVERVVRNVAARVGVASLRNRAASGYTRWRAGLAARAAGRRGGTDGDPGHRDGGSRHGTS